MFTTATVQTHNTVQIYSCVLTMANNNRKNTKWMEIALQNFIEFHRICLALKDLKHFDRILVELRDSAKFYQNK